MSKAEENIAVIRRAIAAVNDGTLAANASVYIAEGCVRNDLARAFPDMVGPGGIGGFIGAVRAALPDFHIDIEDIFGSDDRVVARLVFSGTHEGEFLGVPPTGKRVVFNAVNLYHLRDGKMITTWQLSDLWGFFSQIGVYAPPAL